MLAGILLAAGGPAPPARASVMVPGSPIRPKDFALIKHDGYYHVFFIVNTVGSAPGGNEVELGHAISPDLYHWTQLPHVLHSDSTSWNNSHVWAPSIVYKDSLWWMLYAGTTLITGEYNDTQRMGLAVSSDLMTWNRVEHPVFDATQVPWTWVDSLSSLPAFRDPFVMPDPTTPGAWLMYYTASYGPDSLADVVGVARSTGDFTSWTDVEPLLETWRAYTFNPVTESPHLFEHDGLWYLFISTDSGQPLTFYTTTDPLAAPSGWTYRGRLRSMLGYDTSTWYASEYLRDGTRDLFAFANGDRLEFHEIEWGAGWSFSLLEPPYFHVLGMNWADSSVTVADTARLALRTANWASGGPSLRTFVLDALGNETEVVPESLGLASHPVLASDQDTLAWLPQRWPRVSVRDTLYVMRMIVRTADSTAEAAPIAVRGVAVPDTSHGGDLPPWPNEPIRRPIFRTLSHSPMGGAPAAVVILPDAADARVDLYDVRGRRVRTLAAGRLPRGATVLPWDGRDDAGVPRERGIYFARLVTGGDVRTGRLLLLAR